MKKFLTHASGAILEGSLIALLVVGLMAGTAFAARGGKPTASTGTSSIALAPLVTDHNGDGAPDWSDVVVFNISTTATTAPYVNLVCTQSGTVVLNGWKGYWEGSLDSNGNFGLASGAWQGGSADCTAYLTMQTKRGWSRLASTSFHVGG